MDKTISVWLKIEDKRIALQKRSQDEKSFPFVCQATWSGGVEAGEDVMDAVKRECKEELGSNFAEQVDFKKLEFLTKQEFFRKSKNSIWECHHYMGEINSEILKLAKFHNMAEPRFVFVDKNIDFFSIESGKNPRENVVLFDDQYKILKDIFANENK